ncbi:hypothetical protein PR202_gb01911 [Eleusine coracana subsp. coracana]|uniref:STICHEL DnaA-N-like alpha-beta domain-containing protein n=1 Tax=Eleusine coracana subsp. coracana TaxID=191504 RepID=A0AAV5DXP9_ELECO|nr:hypothetical protein PR202_gb01911 [Eleusine coracana subsp. coracana]
MTWLTAALLQLAPDKQYILPSSSTSVSLNQGDVARNSVADRCDMYAGPHCLPRTSDLGNQNYRNVNIGVGCSNDMVKNYHRGRMPGEHTPDSHLLSMSATKVNEGSKYNKTDNEMIWQAVLETVQSDSLRKLLAKEGQLISVSLGTGDWSLDLDCLVGKLQALLHARSGHEDHELYHGLPFVEAPRLCHRIPAGRAPPPHVASSPAELRLPRCIPTSPPAYSRIPPATLLELLLVQADELQAPARV